MYGWPEAEQNSVKTMFMTIVGHYLTTLCSHSYSFRVFCCVLYGCFFSSIHQKKDCEGVGSDRSAVAPIHS